MRDELKGMELADRYVRGEMNVEDRAAFEERMRDNSALRDLVEDQRALMRGLERTALRTSVEHAYQRFKWGKWAPGLGGGALGLILLLIGLQYMERPTFTHSEQEAEEFLDELPSEVSSDTPNIGIAPLMMTIDPGRDTSMVTPNGVVMDIPRGVFIGQDGAEVKSPVQVTMIEAFDAATIMQAGLSTMSGDTLLETGGMFYLDASTNGKPVTIAPNKSVNVLIPADGVKQGMKLYDGKVGAEDIIDWQDPVELPRTLVPIDMATLNFYPPGYEAKLKELGQDVSSKSFKDSLYFAMTCQEQELSVETIARDIEPTRAVEQEYLPADSIQYRVTSSNRSRATKATNGSNESRQCGIIPTKVKAFWNDRFSGTNLATREFEERMRAIHRSCDNALLDLYVSGLNADLRTLDRQAVAMGHAEFTSFANRNDGRVQLPEGSAERLKELYAVWSRNYAAATRSAHEAYWNRQRELDTKLQQRQRIDLESERLVRDQLLREETDANLASVYSQLGYTIQPSSTTSGLAAASTSAGTAVARTNAPIVNANRRPALPPPPRTVFNARVRTLGWKNIDQILSAASTRRTTTISDGVNAKRASVQYDPCIVTISDLPTFSEVRVYLIPQGTSGYQRMQRGLGNRYEEMLNALFNYDLVVLGQKDGRSWYHEQRNLSGVTQLTASLRPITEAELTSELMRYDRVRGTGLLNASNAMAYTAEDAPRQKVNMDKIRLRQAVEPVVFPCSSQRTIKERVDPSPVESARVALSGQVPIGILNELDAPPTFPGGDQAMRQFIYDNLKNPESVDKEGLTGSVIVYFQVSVDGSVIDVRATAGPEGGCREEAERVVGKMPKWKPAMMNDSPVQAPMSVPVVFLPRMSRLN